MTAEERLYDMTKERDYERLQRVSAQRGLVAYMREHGLADQIGYDPDKDLSLSAIWNGRS